MSRPDTPLAERLQAALGDRYRLERELGAGGMAIVWLAEDVKHRRRVAIKLLRPELAAALGPTRFVREIEIAAQLQHPHILPLLDSGEAEGLAYYVMPYVEGESLRERIARPDGLSLGQALTILRDVSDALAYAHRRGVVHRDVKPDNVMLSDGHALVMDFGVAKALSDARHASQTTSVGMAIGTPAYMAPEQAAGDPNVDHRADIYALGCLAYETLGGRPPFTGSTPQQILAAQISKTPEPLSQVRAGLPGIVTDAVMQCLEKDPARRFETAADFRAALDAASGSTATMPMLPAAPDRWYGHPIRVAGQYAVVAAAVLGLSYFLVLQAGLPDWVFRGAIALLVAGLPVLLATGLAERRRAEARATGVFRTGDETGVGRHLTWARARTSGAVAFAALFLAAGSWMGLRAAGIGPSASLVGAGKLRAKDKLVVAEFDNRSSDSTLGGSVSEAFRIDLGQSGLVSVLSSTQMQAGLVRMGRAAGSRVDTAAARELALREGGKAYVTGEVSQVGTGYVLTARLVSATGGEELVALNEKAADGGALLGAIDRLSHRLRERMGESLKAIRGGDPLAQVTTSSLEALRLYSVATRLHAQRQSDTAIVLLKQAIALDTGFAMAWRKLASLYQNTRAPVSLRMDAAARAYRLRDRLPPVERDQAAATYFWSVEYQPDSAERAFRSVLERNPDDLTALNNYGMLLTRLNRAPEAEVVLRRGLALDSNLSSLYVNLATTLSAQHKAADAGVVLDAYGRHVPAARQDIVFQRMEILSAAGLRDSARALGQAALPGASTVEDSAGLAYQLGAIAATEGRIAEAEGLMTVVERQAARQGRVDDAVGLAAAMAMMRLEYGRDTAGAKRLLQDALQRYQWERQPALDRPYKDLAEYNLELGDAEAVRRVIAEYRTAVPDSLRRADWTKPLEAELEVRQHRATPATLAYLEARADSSSCRQCAAGWLGRMYDIAGMSDSALTHFEQAVPYPGDVDRITADAATLPRAYKRLGELYEQKGNRPKALQYYGLFIELWRNADPDLQPAVREVKQRMAQLAGEPR